jgi:serine/threonine-protein kinase PknG
VASCPRPGCTGEVVNGNCQVCGIAVADSAQEQAEKLRRQAEEHAERLRRQAEQAASPDEEEGTGWFRTPDVLDGEPDRPAGAHRRPDQTGATPEGRLPAGYRVEGHLGQDEPPASGQGPGSPGSPATPQQSQPRPLTGSQTSPPTPQGGPGSAGSPAATFTGSQAAPQPQSPPRPSAGSGSAGSASVPFTGSQAAPAPQPQSPPRPPAGPFTGSQASPPAPQGGPGSQPSRPGVQGQTGWTGTQGQPGADRWQGAQPSQSQAGPPAPLQPQPSRPAALQTSSGNPAGKPGMQWAQGVPVPNVSPRQPGVRPPNALAAGEPQPTSVLGESPITSSIEPPRPAPAESAPSPSPRSQPSQPTTGGRSPIATGSSSFPGTSSRRTASRTSGRGRLGAGLVEVPVVPVKDPASAVLTDPAVSENKRFCSNCGAEVGRSHDGKPGQTEGECANCGAPFNFRPRLFRGDLVGGQYEVLGSIA